MVYVKFVIRQGDITFFFEFMNELLSFSLNFKLSFCHLTKLSHALQIKNLAAELCLDRAIVLELLRDPPPKLLMMSATLPDKPKPPIAIPVSEDMPSVPPEVLVPSEVVADDSAPPEPKVETPIHVLQDSWSAQKRLKKVQLETLENVYRRTKRPTVSSRISIDLHFVSFICLLHSAKKQLLHAAYQFYHQTIDDNPTQVTKPVIG